MGDLVTIMQLNNSLYVCAFSRVLCLHSPVMSLAFIYECRDCWLCLVLQRSSEACFRYPFYLEFYPCLARRLFLVSVCRSIFPFFWFCLFSVIFLAQSDISVELSLSCHELTSSVFKESLCMFQCHIFPWPSAFLSWDWQLNCFFLPVSDSLPVIFFTSDFCSIKFLKCPCLYCPCLFLLSQVCLGFMLSLPFLVLN